MDIMIPFDGGAEESLRYALRSIDKNFKHDKVYLVTTQVPDWIKNVIIVPEEDTHDSNKDANLFDKVFGAIDFGMEGDFMFWSDDQICLKPTEPVVTYNNRDPFTLIPKSKWQRRLLQTAFFIHKMTGIKIDKNFDTHCPQPMNTEKFKKIRAIDYQSGIGLTICTLYFGMNYPVKMESQDALKVTVEKPQDLMFNMDAKTYLGYNEKMFERHVKPFLVKKFEKKSKFEK